MDMSPGVVCPDDMSSTGVVCRGDMSRLGATKLLPELDPQVPHNVNNPNTVPAFRTFLYAAIKAVSHKHRKTVSLQLGRKIPMN